MRCGTIAKKIGMTRLFSEDGNNTPVTVLKFENVQVISILNEEKNGYLAVQVGAGTIKTKNVTKQLRGHFSKSKIEPKRILKEFRITKEMLVNVGDVFSSKHYHIGQKIDVTGTSIGKGFSGSMKRHNFSGLRASHGVSISHRSHGSTGNSQDPGRVFKGKKMAGQYGNVKKTIQNLTVIDVDSEDDLIFVKGSVPGPKNSYVFLSDAIKKELPKDALIPAGLKKIENVENTKIEKVKNNVTENGDKEKIQTGDHNVSVTSDDEKARD